MSPLPKASTWVVFKLLSCNSYFSDKSVSFFCFVAILSKAFSVLLALVIICCPSSPISTVYLSTVFSPLAILSTDTEYFLIFSSSNILVTVTFSPSPAKLLRIFSTSADIAAILFAASVKSSPANTPPAEVDFLILSICSATAPAPTKLTSKLIFRPLV